MPLHTAPLSRRGFLAQTAAVASGLIVLRSGWAAGDETNSHRLALLSDTHIPHAPDVAVRDTNMTDNLRRVVAEVTALTSRPAGVLINGDCAYLRGLPADYANLAQCVMPLAEAGIPLHVTMGNHDDRGPLYDALQAQKPQTAVLDSKHVTILETPHANWFLLDTLTQVNVVTGELGAEQRNWLAQGLAARPDKPALVMAHHTPQFEPPAPGGVWGGIKDTEEFFELLAQHPQVKAFIFGHSHNWSITQRGNLQLINLPPVGYIFEAGKPNGWVLAETSPAGLNLELRALDADHPQNRQRVELKWS